MKNIEHAGRRAPQLALAALLLFALSPTSAWAQVVDDKVTNYVPEGEIKQQEEEVGSGFDGTLAVAANVNLASNSNVVGQVDGFSTLLGASLLAGLDYISGQHEWRNTIKVTQSWARTPVIAEFVKNNDVLDLESLYNYFLATWTGPFARLNLQTAVLPSEDVRAEPANYLVTRNDGALETIANESRLELSGAFSPLTLNESVGWFAEPLQTKPMSISVRVGAGARQTFADGILALTNKDDTPEIDVTELADVYQGGVEGFLGLGGKFMKDRVVYDIGASAMIPFLNNDPENRDGLELTRLGLVGSMSTSVFEWMALTYQFKLLNDPQLLDELQMQHALLLSFQYTLVERTPPPPPPKVDPAEEKLKEAEKRAADAEARAKAAEDRAKAAEEAAKAAPAPAEEPAPEAPADGPVEPETPSAEQPEEAPGSP